MEATLATPAVTETEQQFVLSRIGWDQYESLLTTFPEQAGLRLIFLDRSLTLMSPSYRHGVLAERIADIIKAVAKGLRLSWEQAGHATYRQEDKEAGVEGDKTYYFGEHSRAMTFERAIDLTTQPPPDLAVEIEHTHKADKAIVVWGRLGVPEVWRMEVDPWSLSFGSREADGTYKPSTESNFLLGLRPADVLNQLHLADKLGSSEWFDQLDQWVRIEILPRQKV